MCVCVSLGGCGWGCGEGSARLWVERWDMGVWIQQHVLVAIQVYILHSWPVALGCQLCANGHLGAFTCAGPVHDSDVGVTALALIMPSSDIVTVLGFPDVHLERFCRLLNGVTFWHATNLQRWIRCCCCDEAVSMLVD